MQNDRRERYQIGDLTLDVGACRLTRDAQEVRLPKLSFDFLTALARQAPNMASADELMAEVWGDVIVSDETVAQRVKLLRGALSEGGGAATYVETVRAKGYRLAVPATRLGDDSDQDEKARPRRTYVVAGIALAAVLIALAALYPRLQAPTTTAPISAQSIAVLPFTNMSQDDANEPFTIGIHDDVLTQIAKISALTVISRTSVETLDKTKSIREIGNALGVANVMEGAVQRVGDRVRINVQLIDARADKHIWVETYDRELTARNVFSIQSEIASSVAEHLKATLSPWEKQRLDTIPTENFEAYEAYLLGQQQMAKRTTVALAEAAAYFERATELDPDFALAYVGMADSYTLQVAYSGLPSAETTAKAEAAIERALALDNKLGEAYAALGLMYFERDDAAAEAALKRALELLPNYPPALRRYGILLSATGRAEEALEYRQRARAIDPLSLVANRDLATSYRELGRFEEALAEFERIIQIDAEFTGAYEGIGHINWAALGRLDVAYEAYIKSIALDDGRPATQAWLGLLYIDLGDDVTAEQWITRSLALGWEAVSPNFAMATLHMARGDARTALQYAELALVKNRRWWPPLTYLRNADMRAGRYAEALAQYADTYPELISEAGAVVDRGNFRVAIDLAAVLLEMGESEQANRLLDRSLAFLQTIQRMGSRDYWLADAQIYALRGQKEAALASMRQAFNAGWRTNWRYYRDHEPNLNSIRDEPEFQSIMAEIEADMNAQLARIREVESTANQAGE